MPQQQKYDDETALGLVMLASGDEPLGKAGQALVNRGARRRSRFSALKDGFILDNTTGEVFQDPKVLAHIKETREFERSAPDWQPKEVEGGISLVDVNPHSKSFSKTQETIPVNKPLSDKDRQKATEFDHLATQLDDVATDILESEESTSSPVLDSIIEPLKGFDFLQPAANALEQAAYGDDANIIRQTGSRLESEMSLAMAGLNVTGYEMTARQKWSPFAPGLTDKQKIKRARNLAQIFREKGASIRGANSPAAAAPKAQPAQNNVINFEDLP